MSLNTALAVLFWLLTALVIYSYIGYGLVLFVLVKLKRRLRPEQKPAIFDDDALPSVTVLMAAYNEEDWIEDKIRNSLAFDYPAGKLELLFVTDGSNDRTPEIIAAFPKPEQVRIRLFHQPERRGKIAAVERVMPEVNTSIIVFTDANTQVNPEAIRRIVQHYSNPDIGAVAGEKRIRMEAKAEASSAGEGIYWKYESKLKQWDAELYSVVGAAGELFSVRRDLSEPIPGDTIIEDFYTTLRIAQRGYRVAYEPGAYAVESSSASVAEELKRKIRIAAGGLQAIYRLRALLNPLRYGTLSFQYVSHRVLRWTLAPLALPLILAINIYLALQGSVFFQWMLWAQIAFYLLATIGWFLERRQLKVKMFFIPYYFCMMNYAVYRGFGRFMNGSQSVLWERAKRST